MQKTILETEINPQITLIRIVSDAGQPTYRIQINGGGQMSYDDLKRLAEVASDYEKEHERLADD